MNLSRADHAYELIKNAILTCELEPGAQIAQSQLADLFQIGLTPTREALQRLTQDGFVTAIPRFGYLISPITISDVKKLYEARRIVEPAAVKLAAQRSRSEDLEQILNSAQFTYTFGDRDSYTKFLKQNSLFHVKIASLSGNQRLTSWVATLHEELTRIYHLGLNLRDSGEEMQADHITIATAIIEKNVEWSENYAKKEIDRSEDRVLQALNNLMESESPHYLHQGLQSIKPRF